MQKKLAKIIKVLLELKFEVIYRPHPSNFFEKNVLVINVKYKKFKNFTFDQSNDYTKSFQSSDIIITDMSGTAYTYVVLNSKPVIFFNSEKEIKKFGYDQLNYFKHRSQVGYIVNSTKGIV
ncbi:CDP-glycerol glycerophosphotransferase family protein, partial [Candidatus Pelagibacter ubique]|nr:CDP-glycerol glycerophosphotransferase family protein [Candidatus Pelagibacter ubique]